MNQAPTDSIYYYRGPTESESFLLFFFVAVLVALLILVLGVWSMRRRRVESQYIDEAW